MNRSKRTKQKQSERFLWAVLHDTGVLIHIPAVMSLPVLITAFVLREWPAVEPFAFMAFISVVLGQCLIRFPPKVKSLGERPLSMVVVALSWLVIVLLGAFPFYHMAYAVDVPGAGIFVFRDFANSFFESMSGFTSTGLSVVPDPSRLPATLQLWRSLMEWVGGAGVVLLALLFMKPAEDARKLYVSEARESIFDGSIKKTVQWIWIIYVIYTIFSITLFLVCGMPAWEALNHGLTAIATGGFTVTRDSFTSYSPLIKSAAVLIVLLGAISFHSHYLFWIKKKRILPFQQTQVRTFLGCWIAGLLLIIAIKSSSNQGFAWVDYLFVWTSAIGTCGFNSLPLVKTVQPLLLLLILGMVIGGCSGSTTGGIKTSRFAWAFKAFAWRLKTIWRPGTQKISFYYDQKRISQQEGLLYIETVSSLILLWLGVLFSGSLILLLLLKGEFSFLFVMFDAASALGSVGLSTGVVSAELPASAKYLFSVLMWMGRLEIIAVIVLFSMPNFYLQDRT